MIDNGVRTAVQSESSSSGVLMTTLYAFLIAGMAFAFGFIAGALFPRQDRTP